jgi:CheY-like chemotaxis protein
VKDHKKTAIVLMAEDDEDDCLFVKDAISRNGRSPDLRLVEDGFELLDYLHCRGKYADPSLAPQPDLILLDLNMPRKDGREALKEIKSDPKLKRVPVVVLTASSERVDIDRCYNMGASSYIVKPLTFDDLVRVMKAIGEYWFGTVELPPRHECA